MANSKPGSTLKGSKMQITSNILDKRHIRPKGAADTRNNSLALFHEILKSELREIRSTIEAYSRSGTLKRPHGQLASGLMTNFNNHRITVAVDHGSFIKHYSIDRWD